MIGTMFTPQRDRAKVVGSLVHALNGWLLGSIYVFAFHSLRRSSWLIGGVIGFVHGLFVLVTVLPLLPGVHPRMASDFTGPQPTSGLEPPGFMALNYGRRTPIVTKLVDDGRREEVIARIREACRSGRQAYWVCPLVEESEKLELQAAQETFAALSTTFPELRVGLVHGRLPARDKARTMEAFKAGDIQLLVATTVIEVGVDVPNASLMVIEHAERMGLAQLHQLRGRVGRGAAASVCILLYQGPLSELARARLKVIYENADGFEIARQDLALRGPGEFLGARQSGVPMLRIADPAADQALLEAARDAAPRLLRDFPAAAERHLARWLPQAEEYLKA